MAVVKWKICWFMGIFAIALTLWGCGSHEPLETPEPPATGAPVLLQQQTALEFPYVIREASLVVLQLARYEGPAPQGTDYFVDGAAILVSNPLPRPIEYACIRLRQAERVLIFEIWHLPAGERALVPERAGQLYSDAPVQECSCTELIKMDTVPQLAVTVGDGWLDVCNNGESSCSATVFYKSYYPQGGFFLATKSRSIAVLELAAGERRRLKAEDISRDHTRVAGIKMQ